MAKKLETSIDIYNRIKTDNSFQEHKAIICHFDAIKKKYIDTPLSKWIPIDKGGDIPWTRVYYFKYDGKIIWDREKRLCLIDEIKSSLQSVKKIGEKISVLSLNTLSDKYEKNITKLDIRKNIIIQFLDEKLKMTDIICLQEVNPELGNLITEKFKNLYNIHRSNLDDNDIYIITSLTIIKSDVIEISLQKHFPYICVIDENENEFYIYGIHLTSTSQSNSNLKRLEQTKKILDKIDITKTNIILGDFNQETSMQLFDKFNDSWQKLNKDDKEKGFTFDPINNKYANILTKNKEQKRIDRILYQGDINPETFNVISRDDLSDHYPIECNFLLQQKDNNNEELIFNNQTALTIIPPFNLWKKIMEVSMDKEIDRWMPHINILFGFVDRIDFGITFEKIKHIFDELLPFDIVLDSIDYFQHVSTFTLYLKLDRQSEEKLKLLHKKICDCLNIKINSYNPHLSIGNFRDEELAKKYIKQKVNITWSLDSASIVSRFKETFMQSNITYISKNIQNYDGNLFLNCFFDDILGEYKIYEGGSSIFAKDKNSDNDLLVVGQINKNDFFNKFYKYTSMSGYYKSSKFISNEYTSVVRLIDLYDKEYDIHYLQYDLKANIYDLTFQKLNCDMNSYDSLTILLESYYIANQIKTLFSDKYNVFVETLLELKKNAKQCEIYGQTFGFISGLGWAIMLANLFKIFKNNILNLNKNEILNLFCEYYAEYNYEKPIYLQSCEKNNCNAQMHNFITINRSLYPYSNILRTMTQSSFYKIIETFKNKMNCEIKAEYSAKIIIETFDYQILDEIISWLNNSILRITLKIQKTIEHIYLQHKWIICEQKTQESQYQIRGEFNIKADVDLQSVSEVFNQISQKGCELYIGSLIEIKYSKF
jgi:hypothetical protein